MSKTNPTSTHQFFYACLNIMGHSRIYGVCALTIALLYPGHNKLQSIVLRPGPVYSYTLPSPSFAPYPKNVGTKPPPVGATSYLIQDVESKTVIAERRADVTLPPASITKLMTALVVLDAWPDLGTVLTVQNEDRAIGQTIELITGEQLTVESLLQALLIHSGNDAALALADNYPGGYSEFVAAMNAKARDLNLRSTTFKNPSGIDQYGHLTTARDITTLATVALSNPTIRDIVQTKNLTITDVTGEVIHELESTDELLGVLPGLMGGKTGWTAQAGECFVSYVERDGRGVVTTVLGSTDRFVDTQLLVEWVYANHTWVQISLP